MLRSRGNRCSGHPPDDEFPLDEVAAQDEEPPEGDKSAAGADQVVKAVVGTVGVLEVTCSQRTSLERFFS